MKKKALVLLTILLLPVFAACNNGITQEEYNSVLVENEQLRSENDSLSDQIEELESEKLELTQNVIDYVAENAQTQKEDINLEYNQKYVKLITEQIYGENCSFAIIDNSLYISAFYPQDYSDELYEKMTEDIGYFGSLYNYTKSDAPDDILDFNLISIYCFDKNSNGIVSVSFTQDDDAIQLKDILLNYKYITGN